MILFDIIFLKQYNIKMLSFFFGIVCGMFILMSILTLSYLILTSQKARIKQILNKVSIEKRGALIEPVDESLENWVNNLKEK